MGEAPDVQTGVTAVLSAAHRGADGRLHGHTWEVTAWFPEGDDALDLRDQLDAVIEPMDHDVLPDHLASGEKIARAVFDSLPDCEEVVVSRPLERIHARARARP